MRDHTESGHKLTMDKNKQLNKSMRIVRCPGCGKETPYEGNPYRPFCSRGCKGLDLIHWATEGYRIEEKPDENRADDESNQRTGNP